jgi:hypothetical protein
MLGIKAADRLQQLTKAVVRTAIAVEIAQELSGRIKDAVRHHSQFSGAALRNLLSSSTLPVGIHKGP